MVRGLPDYRETRNDSASRVIRRKKLVAGRRSRDDMASPNWARVIVVNPGPNWCAFVSHEGARNPCSESESSDAPPRMLVLHTRDIARETGERILRRAEFLRSRTRSATPPLSE